MNANKKSMAIYFAMFLTLNLFAQSGFQHRIQSGSLGISFCSDGFENSDGHFVVCSSVVDTGGVDYLQVIKLTASGTFLNEKKLPVVGGNTANQMLIQSSDGTYLVANGRDILKLDGSFNILWHKSFAGSLGEYGHTIQQNTSGDYLSSSETFDGFMNHLHLALIDSSGNLLWSKQLTDSANVAPPYSQYWENHTQTSSDGGFIITGAYSSAATGNSNDILLLRLNAGGIIQWSKRIGGADTDEGISASELADGGFLISGNTQSFGTEDIFLMKLDAAGNVIWVKTYGGSGAEYAKMAIPTSDGGIALAAYSTSFGNVFDNILIKTDSSGNVLWSKSYGDMASLEAGDGNLEETSDGGFLISGYFADTTFSAAGTFIVKADSLGNSFCPSQGAPNLSVNPVSFSSVNITMLETNGFTLNNNTSLAVAGSSQINICTATGLSENIEPAIQLAPNPFNGESVLNCDRMLHQASLIIRHIDGRTVRQTEHLKGESFKINRGDLSAGLYLVTLYENGVEIGSRKMVITD